jgi:hypothetical protein
MRMYSIKLKVSVEFWNGIEEEHKTALGSDTFLFCFVVGYSMSVLDSSGANVL